MFPVVTWEWFGVVQATGRPVEQPGLLKWKEVSPSGLALAAPGSELPLHPQPTRDRPSCWIGELRTSLDYSSLYYLPSLLQVSSKFYPPSLLNLSPRSSLSRTVRRSCSRPGELSLDRAKGGHFRGAESSGQGMEAVWEVTPPSPPRRIIKLKDAAVVGSPAQSSPQDLVHHPAEMWVIHAGRRPRPSVNSLKRCETGFLRRRPPPAQPPSPASSPPTASVPQYPSPRHAQNCFHDFVQDCPSAWSLSACLSLSTDFARLS